MISKIFKPDTAEAVVLTRLALYNRGLPCGARAVRNELECILNGPLPSVSTVNRILSRRCLTHKRTGFYKEDQDV